MPAKLQEKINITAPYGKMPPIDILAENIEKIATLGYQINNSNLSERAILVLLADVTGLSKATIKSVLNALPKLQQYIKANRVQATNPR